MNPRIVAMSGVLKGSEFPVTEAELILGRLPENPVYLEDDLVSRRHCSIQLKDGGVILCDLASRNATFVNGRQVTKKVLEHGDVLKVGSSTFIYLDRSVVDTVPIFIDSNHDRARSISTLRAFRVEPMFPNTDRLQARILELVFETIPAKRAAILLVGRTRNEFVSGTYMPSPFAASQSIAHLILRDGVPCISNDVNSVIGVPLTDADTRLGVLYAENDDPAGFDQTHLDLLTKLASIGSAAFGHARYTEWLEGETERLREEIKIQHRIIGESPRMREVEDRIRHLAPAEANVLILGASGTGKELVARALHDNSRRAQKPFVAVNCAAFAETLLESEIFGHEKGAFTGAAAQRKGKFEIADGGTLFLDEVGEISQRMQAALLRVLQEKRFERVGGNTTVEVDVRVIAATNRNLEGVAMKSGRFRRDLFFRLNVISITLPSLIDRPQDILLLAAHFIQTHDHERRLSGITPAAQLLLTTYHWPGNVRELENAIMHAIVLGKSEHIRPEDLPESLTERKVEESAEPKTYHPFVNYSKRSIVLSALHETGGNVKEAARRLDISESYLHRLMRSLDVEPPY